MSEVNGRIGELIGLSNDRPGPVINCRSTQSTGYAKLTLLLRSFQIFGYWNLDPYHVSLGKATKSDGVSIWSRPVLCSAGPKAMPSYHMVPPLII